MLPSNLVSRRPFLRTRQTERRLLALKRRDPAKGLILIAADFNQIKPFPTYITLLYYTCPIVQCKLP